MQGENEDEKNGAHALLLEQISIFRNVKLKKMDQNVEKINILTLTSTGSFAINFPSGVSTSLESSMRAVPVREGRCLSAATTDDDTAAAP